MCKCVLYYCHRVSTQLQLTNIPYHIICTTRPAGHANIACVTSSRFASYGYSLTLDEDESWVSYSGRFTPGERSFPRTFWIGGWVGPRTNLDAVSRIEPRFLGWLAHSPSRYTEYAAPAPKLHHREKGVTQWDGRNRLRPRKLALNSNCTDIFYVHVTVHHNKLDALISQIYFGNKTLNVSDSSFIHHQELFTIHSAMVYVIQVCRQLSCRIRMFQNKSEKLVHLVGFIIR
jgi:hypothetical protein